MKHDHSTFLHFLRTGELEELKLGMPVKDALAYLGEPDNYDQDRYGHITITYGCLNLHTHSDKPDYIKSIKIRIQDYPEYDLPARLNGNWLPDIVKSSLTEFRSLLHQEKICFNSEAFLIQYRVPQQPSHHILILHPDINDTPEDEILIDNILAHSAR